MRQDIEIALAAKEKIERLLPGSPFTKLGEEVVTGIFFEALLEAKLAPSELSTLRQIVEWDDWHPDGVCLPSQLVEEARDLISGAGSLDGAIVQAKAALVGDSNDAEHDALHSLVTALGYEVPECTCDQPGGRDFPHDTDCPCAAWQAVQTHVCGGMAG